MPDEIITTAPEIAIYSNGSIAIAYRNADTGGLDLMRYTGSWWRHTEMVAEGAAADMVLNIDVNDILHLSFVDTLNERVAIISLDGDARTFSVVDEGEGIGQPLGHHLDATTRRGVCRTSRYAQRKPCHGARRCALAQSRAGRAIGVRLACCSPWRSGS